MSKRLTDFPASFSFISPQNFSETSDATLFSRRTISRSQRALSRAFSSIFFSETTFIVLLTVPFIAFPVVAAVFSKVSEAALPVSETVSETFCIASLSFFFRRPNIFIPSYKKQYQLFSGCCDARDCCSIIEYKDSP